MSEDDTGEPLRFPPVPPAPARAPLPLLTAIVPVIGAVLLWRLTGSPYALWFAALGPLVAAASFIDGLRSARRARRTARRAIAREMSRLDREVVRRHDDERARAWRRTPDVATLCTDAAEIWRSVPGRDRSLVVGRGADASALRIEGDPADDDARALRRRARVLEDAPISVGLHSGVAVRGPAALAVPVARALALQICLVHPPGRVRVADGGALASVVPGADDLPHALAGSGSTLRVTDAAAAMDADIPIVVVEPDAPAPPRCAAVLTLESADRGRLDHEGVTRSVRVEAVSVAQSEEIVAALAERARDLGQRIDAPLTIEDLPSGPKRGLAAAVGVGGGEVVVLDLVVDGPHAVIIGMTGTGKSELLTTWVAGMCRGRGVEQITFLLVDFKGGRAFDPLAALPHVTGVLTDLDDAAALRAIESLRAEIRRREQALADVAARDVDEAAGALARLVIVVDEYAALVGAHPELHELFADIAARGRALGMHLILASQRAGGAFRDGVLANAPLRIAFRTADTADSRAVLGTDEAALLSGDPKARGTALMRRAADTEVRRVRVARCTPAALDAIREGAGTRAAVAAWLPPLPARVPLARIARAGHVVLGLVDEPDRQRQPVLELPQGVSGFAVIGAAGSGRTSLLRTVAEQLPAPPLWVPADAEGAWDAIACAVEDQSRSAVLFDDIDAVASRLPPEYAAELVARVERAVREARAHGTLIVLSAARIAGPLSRVVELLPHRAVLSMPTRADHVAAGGEARGFVRDQPAGRGRWSGALVQFAETGPWAPPREPARPPLWVPAAGDDGPGMTGLVTGPGSDLAEMRSRYEQRGVRVMPVEQAAAAGVLSEPVMSASTAASGRVGEPLVVHGSPESWLAQWRPLAAMRERYELVIAAECAAEFRAISGRRELPPYALPSAGRAWHLMPGAPVRRVVLTET
ncbi:cell division protein FtsK [Microbacterium sp. VKM Ac-2870]|uniref:FtsK/SpoIIIE domain-containing protein n=1 Tax=Microbacterium sp. VKM Ac-2870 TaxID=2783825 RepID=UPI00188A1418|nr:FtsK/SpoIIIE domain-containing protein [Microbacterium sp. VKM Ac-2870]MBF4561813.1 cell division protein FtsK [Microbacterium sp. VKM Ac-2870]